MSAAEAPRVTVLMSVRNGERFLDEAVRSILGQTFQDIEFLIVDDGSTDGTPAILTDAAARDGRVRRLVNREPLGLTRSLNRGLREARGRLIARMDADDVSLPRRLERQVEFMAEHPEVAAVGCWCEVIDETGRASAVLRPPTDPRAIKRAFLSSAPILHPAALIRRAALDEVGGYDESFELAQDRDLFLRLLARYDLGVVPEVLFRHRRTPSALGLEREMAQKAAALRAGRRAIAAGTYPRWRAIDLWPLAVAPWLPAPVRRIKNRLMRLLGLRHEG